jgi:PAS domain-containing protein
MTASFSDRPALRLVQPAGEPAVEWTWFCGHCAAPAPSQDPPPPHARVCRSCGLGLLLEARSDAAPEQDDSFLVVDSTLLIQAVSQTAERLLGVTEEEAINQPVSQLLVPADAEARGATAFAAAVADALSSEEPSNTFVRPWNTFGVRMRVKIAACGPPAAALLVLDAAPRGLRLVR